MNKFLKSSAAFIKKRNKIVLFILVLAIGAYLRIYRFDDLVRFNTDQVRDVLVVEKILEGEEFPLLGPKAGGTTFKLGPAFYYLEAASGFIFGNSPSGMAAFVAILAVVSIPLLFFFLRYYFSFYISLLLMLIYSFSFYVIKYSRFTWNPNIIPFFFILFCISLLKIMEDKNKKFGIRHILLAVSLGISVQLHTLLLILMPILFLLAIVYIYFKEKKVYLLNIILISLIALLLNAPFFVYDFQNDGKNLKSFWAGTQKKTEKNASLAENILNDGQFFIQGNTYAISSFEPQKNWIKVKKLLDSKKAGEIIAAFAGAVFFLFGLFQLVERFLKEKYEKRRNFLGLIFITSFLSFLILLPIANELNVRYFIILIFLPYIFLGFLAESLLKNLPKKLALVAIIVLSLFLAFINLRWYVKTYNLENYTARTSSYGGISVKESRDISNFMSDLSEKRDFPERIVFPSSFKFAPSIEYFNDKKKMQFTEASKQDQYSDLIFFTISDQKDVEKTLKEKEVGYKLIDSLKTGRFTVFAFEKK